ncbi:MAG TPA: Omp28-related outer membrane protein, partial [Candidatus Kapabacteria bacterium]|nr:Omp28-related outer membrane protein [Candidatus Kapabacteria bacterium]
MRSLRYLIVLTAALGMLAITNVQAQQRMVLWEEFTQWNCPPCGQANPGIEKMLGENWKNVIHIWYHGNFPDVNDDPMYLFNSSDHQGRYNYYSINSEPQCAIDGQQYQQNAQDYLGDPQDTNYDKTLLANAEGASTPVSIAITETPDGSGGAGVHIVVSSTQALSGNYMLRVAVVKAVVDTPNVGTPYRNPEVQFLNVMQKMLPDYNGSSVSIATAGGQQTFDFTYSGTDIMPTNNPSHVFVVAWVQNDANKHILNTSSDYISTTMAAAPSFMVADPGQTNSFNPSVTNSGSTPIKVISSLTTSAPNAWQVNYNVNSGTTAYTGADTTTVAAGQTASYKVNFAMTGGKGIGHAALALQEVNGDTVINSINDFYSASSDVNTAIVDETAGNTTRASVYQSALSSISNSSH